MIDFFSEQIEQLSESQFDALISEALDGVSTIQLTNVKPKSKIPCAWKVETEGNDNLLFWLSNFNSKSLNYKQIKPGDKFMQAWFLSLSSSGAPGVMRGNLGKNPIGVMTACFDKTIETMKDNNMDGVLFRFQPKKMKNIDKLHRIMAVLLAKRGQGFTMLREMAELTGDKYYYILVYRKARGITGIPQIGLDMSLFNVVKDKIGDIVVNKKTGEEMTKAQAIAMSVAAKADTQSESQAAKAVHIKKEDLLIAFSSAAGKGFDHAEEYGQIKVSSEKRATVMPPSLYSRPDLLSSATVEKALGGTEKFKDFLKKYTNNKGLIHLTPKNIGKMMTELDNLGAGRQAISAFVNALNHHGSLSYGSIVKSEAFTNEQNKLSSTQKTAIKSYCGKNYVDINRVFTHNDEPTSSARRWIKNLDEAFATAGVTMNPGTTLYRGMRAWKNIANVAVQNKAFYFRNYVSTSLRPMLFNSGTWGRSEMAFMQKDYEGSDASSYQRGEEAVNADFDSGTFMGFMIDPKDVPCLIPGTLSPHITEAEVIMPRGTVFVFDQVTTNNGNTMMLVDGHATFIDKLTESVVYDGDALINEGVIKPLDFKSFLAEEKSEQLTPAEMKTMLKYMNFEGVPSRFLDGAE